MCKFENGTAEDFIALELALDWGRKEDEGGKSSPLLNKDVTMIGVSNKAHKAAVNVIQVLYITNSANAME